MADNNNNNHNHDVIHCKMKTRAQYIKEFMEKININEEFTKTKIFKKINISGYSITSDIVNHLLKNKVIKRIKNKDKRSKWYTRIK